MDFDHKNWFAKGEDGEISVGVELNESSDHKYEEIIFYDKNKYDIAVISVMRSY